MEFIIIIMLCGGSQIVNREYLYGNDVYSEYSKKNVHLYHREKCKLIKDAAGNPEKYDQIFLTEDDAVRAGYLPCQLCN